MVRRSDVFAKVTSTTLPKNSSTMSLSAVAPPAARVFQATGVGGVRGVAGVGGVAGVDGVDGVAGALVPMAAGVPGTRCGCTILIS